MMIPILNLPEVFNQQYSEKEQARRQKSVIHLAKLQKVSNKAYFDYLKQLQAIVHDVKQQAFKALSSAILKTDGAMLDKAGKRIELPAQRVDVAKLLSAIENMERTPKKAEAIAKKFVNTQKMASEHHFISLVQTSTGVDVKQFLAGNAFVAKETERLTSQNAKLITALHHDLIEQIKASVTQSAMAGGLSKDLAKAIQERAKVGESRARLIARDQKAKVNAAIDRANQEACGVQKYIWSSSKDERVRDRHADLDGHVFEWKTPVPVAGYPAQEVNCRCVAIPVFSKMIEASKDVRVKAEPELLKRIELSELFDGDCLDDFDFLNERYNELLDKMKDEIRKHNLSKDESYYIFSYTSTSYRDTNKLLRDAMGAELSNKYIAYYAKVLSKALDKLPDYPAKTYRGINVVPSEIAKLKERYKKGYIVTEHAFTSTTRIEGKLKPNNNVKFVIQGKTGKSIEKLSRFEKEEREVVFKAKTKFIVSDVIETEGKLIIKMSEVEQCQF